MQLLTYQCSQLSTPESIIDVFNSAQKLQNSGRSQLQGVSLVVLDEVGLAEDSPTFPLKALHPLLEDGTDGSGMEGKVSYTAQQYMSCMSVSAGTVCIQIFAGRYFHKFCKFTKILTFSQGNMHVGKA